MVLHCFCLKLVDLNSGDVTFHTLLHRADVPEPKAVPESVHWCDFPPAQQPWKGDDQIQRSVARMQTVIELSRTIRYSTLVWDCIRLTLV